MAQSRLMLGTFFCAAMSSLPEEESAVSETLEMESDPVQPASAEPPESSPLARANKVREEKLYFLVSPPNLVMEQFMLRDAASGWAHQGMARAGFLQAPTIHTCFPCCGACVLVQILLYHCTSCDWEHFWALRSLLPS